MEKLLRSMFVTWMMSCNTPTNEKSFGAFNKEKDRGDHEGERVGDVDQSDTTSRRHFTRSQAKDLQALQALWMKMEPLEGSNMEDLKIFNILSVLPF
ncbi:hypothetical protein KY284_036326 [Solanum tuberosum]|nr:hypothetical protein KY284_036326 [Solanum tuberosum]